MVRHARRIVQLLMFRPEALDEEGEYDSIKDEDQMIQIVENYLNANSADRSHGSYELMAGVRERYKQLKGKVPDYKSFSMGWIEGRSHLIKLEDKNE